MNSTKNNTGCTPYQLARDLSLLVGSKITQYGETVLRAQVHPATIVIEIEKRSVIKKGRREITKITRRIDRWTLDCEGWNRTDTLPVEETEAAILAFGSPTAQEKRESDYWASLGGILDRDGYRKPVCA